MGKIKKAVTAGIGGGIVAAAGVLYAGGVNSDTVKQAAGAFIVGVITVGYATWQTPPNKLR